MTTTLVTGGTGTVGAAVVRRFVGRGDDVRVLVRSDASAAIARDLGAEPVDGDVLDAAAVRRAAAGCDLVLHVAGRSGLCRADHRAMQRLNVEGTEIVIREAAAAGVRRVVHTSSAATLGEARGAIGDERTTHRGRFLSRYERSKFAAERLAFALGSALDIEVVAVNPASVQGPGRTRGSARLILDLVGGRLPVLVDTWISIVDVEDCASGHLLAAERGVPGERYVLAGAAVPLRDAVATLRRIWGVPERARFVPTPVARAIGVPAGAAGSLVSRATGRSVRICAESVTTLLHGHRYDGSRATRELGLAYAPLEDTLRRALTWYAEHGLVPPPRLG